MIMPTEGVASEGAIKFYFYDTCVKESIHSKGKKEMGLKNVVTLRYYN
jgi:hypothetical protein